jgi:hypothetical protein
MEIVSEERFPVGVPLVALYMQPPRVYKYWTAWAAKLPSWALCISSRSRLQSL